MRRMPISKLQAGMILGKSLYSANGNILLSAGTELNPAYAKRLQALGFPAVMITDNFCEGIVFSDVVSDSSRIHGVKTLRRVFEETKKYKQIDTKLVKGLVNVLVDEILQNRHLVFEFPDIRSYDSYLYAHCLNVCILSLRVGIQLNYNEFQLRDLGVGAITHDIGAMFITPQVAEKPGRLSPQEFNQMREHSIKGFNLLREQKDVNLLSAHVAFQHHERIDGSGYPRALKSSDICEFARVVAIADLFDALVSERKHRKAYNIIDAVEMVKKEAEQKMDSSLTELFLKNVAVYSTGSLLELNSGEIGMVTANVRPYLTKPMLKLMTDCHKQPVSPESMREINLLQERELAIVKTVDDESLVNRLAAVHGAEKELLIVSYVKISGNNSSRK